MKSSNVKSMLLLFFEILLIAVVSVLLYILDLSLWINLIVCIMLILETLWISKINYNNDNTNIKFMTGISFILMGIGYAVVLPVNILFDIPGVMGATYMILQGHLLMTGCINLIKRSNKDAKTIKRDGMLVYLLMIVLAILSLFGVIK